MRQLVVRVSDIKFLEEKKHNIWLEMKHGDYFLVVKEIYGPKERNGLIPKISTIDLFLKNESEFMAFTLKEDIE